MKPPIPSIYITLWESKQQPVIVSKDPPKPTQLPLLVHYTLSGICFSMMLELHHIFLMSTTANLYVKNCLKQGEMGRDRDRQFNQWTFVTGACMLVTNHTDRHTVTATLEFMAAERSVNMRVWCHNYGLRPGVSPLISVCAFHCELLWLCVFVYTWLCINLGKRWGHMTGQKDTHVCFGLILSLFQQSTWL